MEYHVGADFVDLFVKRADYYNRIFKNILKVNFSVKEEAITPLTTNFYNFKEKFGDDCAEHHDHVNGEENENKGIS